MNLLSDLWNVHPASTVHTCCQFLGSPGTDQVSSEKAAALRGFSSQIRWPRELGLGTALSPLQPLLAIYYSWLGILTPPHLSGYTDSGLSYRARFAKKVQFT